MKQMKKAFFIDRDGVINSDKGHYYIYRKEDFVFNPDIEKALKQIKKTGYLIVLITNQGGVAKGEYTESDVKKVHAYMQENLQLFDADFDAIYYCPHHDSIEACECRKPKPGMIFQAVKDLSIQISQSYLIGDSIRDIEAGVAAGLKQCYQVEKNTSIFSLVNSILNEESRDDRFS